MAVRRRYAQLPCLHAGHRLVCLARYGLRSGTRGPELFADRASCPHPRPEPCATRTPGPEDCFPQPCGPGQTSDNSSSFVTSCPRRLTSATSRSKAREPSGTGFSPRRSCRWLGKRRNEPKWISSASDIGRESALARREIMQTTPGTITHGGRLHKISDDFSSRLRTLRVFRARFVAPSFSHAIEGER